MSADDRKADKATETNNKKLIKKIALKKVKMRNKFYSHKTLLSREANN